MLAGSVCQTRWSAKTTLSSAMYRNVQQSEFDRVVMSLGDAVSAVLRDVHALPPVSLPIAEALACVAQETIVAPADVPGFLSAAMDGYAVRHADCAGATADHPRYLPVAGTSVAGGGPVICAPGSACKVMTGGWLPEGSDTVVPWEYTDLGRAVVGIRGAPRLSENVRQPGEEIAAGQILFGAGTLMSPLHIAALAAIGRSSVVATPKPRIGILTTGDEIVQSGATCGPGQIFDSNGPFLSAFVAMHGASPVLRASSGDQRSIVKDSLTRMAQSVDLVVTTGGASVGEQDWVREIVEVDGCLVFWRVSIKPGKPVAYGRLAGTPLLALPGNPNSVAACSAVFLGPILQLLSGRDPEAGTIRAQLAEQIAPDRHRTLLVPVRLEGGVAIPMSKGHRAGLGDLTPADGVAIVSPQASSRTDEVNVVLFPTLSSAVLNL